jgi:pimeloyl-ACP methyl ester carboxylesterase
MSSQTEVRPFRVGMPEEAITDLRRRIAATRWPSKELVADRSQGVQLETIQERAAAVAAGQVPPEVAVPVGFTTFPGEIFAAPRGWVEKVYPSLTYFNEVDRGGHFAAWEEPELFATEIRAAFRSLR